jgi:hypothetical protein
MGADTGSLERIFEKFNIDHPQDFTGHSLSVSDIVTLNRDGSETAHYVDSFGFKEVPEFLQPAQDFDLYAATDRLQKIHDNVMQADPNKIMGEAAYRMGIKRLEKLQGEIPATQPALKMLVEHAAGSTDLVMLKERMASTMQQINPIQTAEMSTEQNYNMIDGIPNNSPSVGELEAKAKAGELINLSDLAAAIKADKAADHDDSDKKPSIRAQLAEGKAAAAERSKPALDKSRDKSPDLEV